MKCYWCNGVSKNITINEKKIVEIRPCNNCNQPERLSEKTHYNNEEEVILEEIHFHTE